MKRGWQAAVLALALLVAGVAQAAEPVVMFAAASLTNAFTEVGKAWEAAGHPAVRFSFASSSTLAKQIETGAPAAIFASADEDWMNYLAKRNLIDAASRTDLVGNKLVLIVPVDRNVDASIGKGFDLAGFLGDSRLATGDPDHVPVGKYAQQALTSLGLWDVAKPRLLRAEDVRSALAYVERGEVNAGIVYATDAAITQKVRVAGEFPRDSYPPVVYPIALIAGPRSANERAFFDFLKTPQARAIYARYGFSAP
jgi:molybdate transport system substrate-binding protein